MHELLPRIVADPAAMHAESGIAQSCGIHAGHPDINSHRLHVQAVLSDRPRMAAEKSIAPRRAVTTDHIDFRIRVAESTGQIVQQIEQPRIEMVDRSGAVVAKKVLQLVDGRRNILLPAPVNDIEPFIGVSVIQPKTVRRDVR